MEFNLGYILARASWRQPDKIALISGERRVTYREFNSNANRIATVLLHLGLQKGETVGILLNNSCEYMEIIFGILKAGGVVVPLNTRLSPTELSFIINKCGSRFFFYGSEFKVIRETLMEVGSSLAYCLEVGQGGEIQGDCLQVLASSPGAEPEVPVTGQDLGLILFTSGTTGRPKGACLTHASILWNCVMGVVNYRFTNVDIKLLPTQLFHLAGIGRAFTIVFCGATIIPLSRFKAEEFLQIVEQERVTSTIIVPTMAEMILGSKARGSYDVSSLRRVFIGAAISPPELIASLLQAFPAAGIYHAYGMSEAMFVSVLQPEDAWRKLGSVGKSNLLVDLRIVDDQLVDVEPGQAGEILVKGPAVMEGYYREPEATAETFCSGWLRTGDIGRVDEEGYLFILDRKKDMIISGGENIYSAEVERVILTYPGVKEVAVIGLPDRFWGESVAAVVVKAEGQEVMPEAIIEHCAKQLAGYKKPRFIFFADELPRNATNKVLKRVLKEKYRHLAT